MDDLDGTSSSTERIKIRSISSSFQGEPNFFYSSSACALLIADSSMRNPPPLSLYLVPWIFMTLSLVVLEISEG